MVSATLWVAVSTETRTRTTSPDLVLTLSQYASNPASRNCRCSSRPRLICDTAATCTRLPPEAAAGPGDVVKFPVGGAVLAAGAGAAAAVDVAGAVVLGATVAAGLVGVAVAGVVVRGVCNSAGVPLDVAADAWPDAGSVLGFGASAGTVVRLDDGVADGWRSGAVSTGRAAAAVAAGAVSTAGGVGAG